LTRNNTFFGRNKSVTATERMLIIIAFQSSITHGSCVGSAAIYWRVAGASFSWQCPLQHNECDEVEGSTEQIQARVEDIKCGCRRRSTEFNHTIQHQKMLNNYKYFNKSITLTQLW